MSTQQLARYQAILDARAILCTAYAETGGGLATDVILSASAHLTKQLDMLALPVLTDEAGECDACGREVDDLTDHDCEAAPLSPWPTMGQSIGWRN